MARHTCELTDEQWAHIAPLLPEPKASPKAVPNPSPTARCLKAFWVVGYFECDLQVA